MLTTAVFKLVQQFYHAAEIGNAANAVRTFGSFVECNSFVQLERILKSIKM